MSKTPRTEAAKGFFDLDSAVSAEFASRLETELNDAHKAFVVATNQLVQVREENARLRTKIAWLAGQLADHPCACQWLDDTISELLSP